MNRRSARCLAIASLLSMALAGCASSPDRIPTGLTRAEVIARFGAPAGERDGVLVYSTAPWGQYAYAAHFDGAGRVASVEQVLTTQQFATVQVGVWNKARVRSEFGAPVEVRVIGGQETWSYRYREGEVWNSLMSIMFDASGLVSQTINGPDPMYDHDRAEPRD